MELSWDDITVDISEVNPKRLTEAWSWLLPNTLEPILVSSVGDMFLKDKTDEVYWLNTGMGKLTKVAASENEFIVKMNDPKIADDWFMFDLISELKTTGMQLMEGYLYSYILPPIIGGQYITDNFELTDAASHFEYCGKIHEQVKDLPDGAIVEFEFDV